MATSGAGGLGRLAALMISKLIEFYKNRENFSVSESFCVTRFQRVHEVGGSMAGGLCGSA